jgi:hypothetical protein
MNDKLDGLPDAACGHIARLATCNVGRAPSCNYNRLIQGKLKDFSA